MYDWVLSMTFKFEKCDVFQKLFTIIKTKIFANSTFEQWSFAEFNTFITHNIYRYSFEILYFGII